MFFFFVSFFLFSFFVSPVQIWHVDLAPLRFHCVFLFGPQHTVSVAVLSARKILNFLHASPAGGVFQWGVRAGVCWSYHSWRTESKFTKDIWMETSANADWINALKLRKTEMGMNCISFGIVILILTHRSTYIHTYIHTYTQTDR